jgi:hypothetical protein
LINDDNGECVGVFLLVEVHIYYMFIDLEEPLNIDFVIIFYEKHENIWVLTLWWREEKTFTNRTSRWYPMAKLRELYIYLMALICHLYGEKYCSRFSEAWIPLAYMVSIYGRGFN